MTGVRVKPPVWQNDMLFGGQPHAYADTPLGPWTVTAYDGRGGRWAYDDPSGDTSDMDWPTREEAQAAAQADYETRILAALDAQAPSAIASEAPERLWLDVQFRELFLPGEEQYGIQGLVEYRRAALEPQDAPAVAGVEIPAGYTPGPWRIDNDPTGSGVYADNDGYHGVDAGPGYQGRDGLGFSISAFMRMADARLIALAPAMAEELVALRAEVAQWRNAGLHLADEYPVSAFGLPGNDDVRGYGWIKVIAEMAGVKSRKEVRAALTPPASQEGQADG